MISGLLPVVGVPMPLMSYGGTSAVSLLVGFGLVMGCVRIGECIIVEYCDEGKS